MMSDQEIVRCIRCFHPAPSDDPVANALWEVFEIGEDGWVCPDCVTPEELQLIHETTMSLLDEMAVERAVDEVFGGRPWGWWPNVP